MAKDLPYFKFYVTQYIAGKITLLDFYTQGVFINICSHYWHKSGCLDSTEIKQRLKCKPTSFNKLLESGVIKSENGHLVISFLDEQLQERSNKSKINSVNGSRGGAPKGNKNAQKPNNQTTEKQPKTTNIEEEKEEELEKELEKNIYIILNGEKIFNPIDYLEFYQVQLNGMQKENGNISWRAKISDWMLHHAEEEFNDGMHLKNSFKKFYLNDLEKNNKPKVKPLHELQ